MAIVGALFTKMASSLFIIALSLSYILVLLLSLMDRS